MGDCNPNASIADIAGSSPAALYNQNKMNRNKIELAGRLTRDPELKFTATGVAICRIGFATSRQWKDDSGQKKEETLFVDCTAFGKQGEAIAQYFKKGRQIFIDGRLKLDQWEDKETKEKRNKIAVIVESFAFLDSEKKSEPAPKPAEKPEAEGNKLDSSGDSVPF